ncbi:hypothetical protein [Frondihabitans cladoniiphilus]|uniref:Uncharacterized protein n=1 Tax=Frondihabitans cladoniiphilus TaxID=715785 RepID=A0ABP8VTR6_9MICO
MSDTASIHLPRTGSIRTGASRTASIRAVPTARLGLRARISAALALGSPRQAYAAGTYVIVDRTLASGPNALADTAS